MKAQGRAWIGQCRSGLAKVSIPIWGRRWCNFSEIRGDIAVYPKSHKTAGFKHIWSQGLPRNHQTNYLYFVHFLFAPRTPRYFFLEGPQRRAPEIDRK